MRNVTYIHETLENENMCIFFFKKKTSAWLEFMVLAIVRLWEKLIATHLVENIFSSGIIPCRILHTDIHTIGIHSHNRMALHCLSTNLIHNSGALLINIPQLISWSLNVGNFERRGSKLFSC